MPRGRQALHRRAQPRPPVKVLFQSRKIVASAGPSSPPSRQAIADGMDIVVKIDGDGQMNPALLPNSSAHCCEGADPQRQPVFHALVCTGHAPVRLFGNAVLSFMTKLSCGYWNLMDHQRVLRQPAPACWPSCRWTSWKSAISLRPTRCFRLNTLRAVVKTFRWIRSMPTRNPTSRSVRCCLGFFKEAYIALVAPVCVQLLCAGLQNVGTLLQPLWGLAAHRWLCLWAMHWLDSARPTSPPPAAPSCWRPCLS